MRYLLVFFVLLLVESSSAGGDRSPAAVPRFHKDSILKPTFVVIKNELPAGQPDLTVHCKSKNDDLGFHVLKQNQVYQFHFVPSFWGNTLFFCSFRWGQNFHYFDIYDGDRDDHHCKHCFRSIKPGGPCLVNDRNPEHDGCYPWNKS